MGRASRDKGARWERAVTTFLRGHGFPWAERRPGGAPVDHGDIWGVLGAVVECKDVATLSLSAWCDQAAAAAKRSRSPVWVVVAKRARHPDPADAYAVTSLAVFTDLLRAAGYGTNTPPLHTTDSTQPITNR